MQFYALAQRRAYHEQGRDILRADVARHLQRSAFKFLSPDEQWGETFLVGIFNFRPKIAQGIHEQAYWTMPHTVGSRYEMLAVAHAVICSQEPHSRTSGLDVHHIGIVAQSFHHHVRIIAV